MAERSEAERKARAEKRAQKRLKQRAANILRAKKMHLCRVGDPQSSVQVNPQERCYIGCSGWFYWHWRGTFYPSDLPTADWFTHYASHFETVELNAPFYSWPTVNGVKTWVRQTKGAPFYYTVKVCELITHVKRFRSTKTLISDFYYIGDLLGPLMGCFLFQMPPSFHYSESRLANLLDQLDEKRRNVVEFRHASWWNKSVFKACRKKGVTFCSASAPKLPQDLIETSDDLYIRFHGTKNWYRHNYDLEELKKWHDQIEQSKAKRVWIYFNNDFGGNAIANAATLRSLLNTSVR